MFEPLLIAYGNLFHWFESEGKDGYLIIKCTVPRKILHEYYLNLTRQGEKRIEDLEVNEKQMFWDKAKQYFSDKGTAIEASKAAYVLWYLTR